MGYDFTDSIDECCEAIVGHTNWGFADKSDYEKIMSRRNGDHPNSDRIHSIVIFYNDEEDEYVYNLKCNNCGAMTCAEKAFFYKDKTFCEDCCPDGYGE